MVENLFVAMDNKQQTDDEELNANAEDEIYKVQSDEEDLAVEHNTEEDDGDGVGDDGGYDG